MPRYSSDAQSPNAEDVPRYVSNIGNAVFAEPTRPTLTDGRVVVPSETTRIFFDMMRDEYVIEFFVVGQPFSVRVTRAMLENAQPHPRPNAATAPRRWSDGFPATSLRATEAAVDAYPLGSNEIRVGDTPVRNGIVQGNWDAVPSRSGDLIRSRSASCSSLEPSSVGDGMEPEDL